VIYIKTSKNLIQSKDLGEIQHGSSSTTTLKVTHGKLKTKADFTYKI
jgi:hypothetical protein